MASSLSNTPFSALFQATQRGRYITFFTLIGDISRRQVIFHVGRCYFTSSSKSRNTHEISDIFHFAAIHFLPERHSAMVLIFIYICMYVYHFFSMVPSRVHLQKTLTVQRAQRTGHFIQEGVALTNSADNTIAHTLWKKGI